jgi:hypothetical protein
MVNMMHIGHKHAIENQCLILSHIRKTKPTPINQAQEDSRTSESTMSYREWSKGIVNWEDFEDVTSMPPDPLPPRAISQSKKMTMRTHEQIQGLQKWWQLILGKIYDNCFLEWR